MVEGVDVVGLEWEGEDWGDIGRGWSCSWGDFDLGFHGMCFSAWARGSSLVISSMSD